METNVQVQKVYMLSLLKRVAPSPSPDVAARAAAMAAAGNRLDAIALAAASLKNTPSPALEKALIAWRAEAFCELPPPTPSQPWPAPYPDPAPGTPALLEISPDRLDAHTLGGAILHHGSACIRGLLSRDEADALRQGIDATFAAREALHAGTATPDDGVWYSPFDWGAVSHRGTSRPWSEAMGSIWMVDSPRMVRIVLDTFERHGLIEMIAAYLGERPAMSMGKTSLRRVDQKPKASSGHGWHQDGAFLGNVRSVNVWLALSECGVDAPGLDIVARRLPYVLQTGSHGASLDWTVGGGVVELLEEGGATVVSPVFQPGDAMIFDHLMLHRTSAPPQAIKPRWAIESWFFAPSAFPMDQGPFVI